MRTGHCLAAQQKKRRHELVDFRLQLHFQQPDATPGTRIAHQVEKVAHPLERNPESVEIAIVQALDRIVRGQRIQYFLMHEQGHVEFIAGLAYQ